MLDFDCSYGVVAACKIINELISCASIVLATVLGCSLDGSGRGYGIAAFVLSLTLLVVILCRLLFIWIRMNQGKAIMAHHLTSIYEVLVIVTLAFVTAVLLCARLSPTNPMSDPQDVFPQWSNPMIPIWVSFSMTGFILILVLSVAITLIMQGLKHDRRTWAQSSKLQVTPVNTREARMPHIRVVGLTPVPGPEAFIKREKRKWEVEQQLKKESPEKDLFGFDDISLA